MSNPKPVSIAKCIESMEGIVAHSHLLWLHVNKYILRLLRRKTSRAVIVARLRKVAGPARKNEPACIGNYRVAARQLERGYLVRVL